MGQVLKAGLSLVTEEEAQAVWEALGQFVENSEEAAGLAEEEGQVAPHLKAARELLDKLNSCVAELAG